MSGRVIGCHTNLVCGWGEYRSVGGFSVYGRRGMWYVVLCYESGGRDESCKHM